ncbi:BRO family antirepressor protein [Staphylococcus phage phi879]|nr:BRO family antirepressor protein [Staphylococcus phage phi879]
MSSIIHIFKEFIFSIKILRRFSMRKGLYICCCKSFWIVWHSLKHKYHLLIRSIAERSMHDMQELQIFNFNSNEVRTVVVNEEPYFVGNDVAQILGYEDYRGAINKKVDEEDKLRSQIDYAGQKRTVTLIN